MSSAQLVYQALKTFDRPATRAELQKETGLDRHGVHAGIRVLREQGYIDETGAGERKRGLYQLKPGPAPRWPDRRKKLERDAPLQEAIERLEGVLDILKARLAK